MEVPKRGFHCIDCGEWADKYPNRHGKKICTDCGIRRAAAHNRAMAAKTAPHMDRDRAFGLELARQIEAREGPLYEKWRDGIKRAAQSL